MKTLLSFICLLLLAPPCLRAEFDQVRKEEFLLGLYLANRVEKTNKVLKDHPEMERIMQVVARITDVAAPSNLYTFQVIEAPVANAFALPGGFVFITDKLLELKLNDDELAFLVGHEISHVQKRHFSRIQKESTKVGLLNALAAIGAIVLMSQAYHNEDARRAYRQQGSHGTTNPSVVNEDAVNVPPFIVPIVAGNMFGTLYLMHSHREYELESDNAGAKLAMDAGYTLKRGVGMLEKLFYANYRDAKYEIWQTHPLTNDRIQALNSGLASYKAAKPKSEDYLVDFKQRYAERILSVYADVPKWKIPSMFRDSTVKVDALRKLLLDRAYRLTASHEVRQKALTFEITEHLLKDSGKQPFLSTNYGEIQQKIDQLKSVGGEMDKELEKQIRERRDRNLQENMKKMITVSPGFQMLEFMLRNYPAEKDARQWEIDKWLKAPDTKEGRDPLKPVLDLDEKTRNAAHVLSISGERRAQVVEELQRLKKVAKAHPLYYRRVSLALGEPADAKAMQEVFSACTELEALARYQHEYSADAYTDMALKRKSQLTEQCYKVGRLAGTAGDKSRAVEAFHEILLYNPGSELEGPAREQIYKLNTLVDRGSSWN